MKIAKPQFSAATGRISIPWRHHRVAKEAMRAPLDQIFNAR